MLDWYIFFEVVDIYKKGLNFSILILKYQKNKFKNRGNR